MSIYKNLIYSNDLIVYESNEDLLDLVTNFKNDILYGARIGSVYYRLHEDDEGNKESHYYKIRYIVYSMRGRKYFVYVIHIEMDYDIDEVVDIYQENYELARLVCDPLTIQVTKIPDTIKKELLKKLDKEL